MAQNYKKLVSGEVGVGTPIANYPDFINETFDAVRSDFSGTSFPTDPIVGQTFFNAQEGKEYRYFGSPPSWQDSVASSATVSNLNTEVIQARGTGSSTLNDRLIKISSNNANSTFPTKDVYVGMDFYDTVNKIEYKCISMVDGEGGTPLWVPISEVIPAIRTASDEVKIARGTADSLNARLDVSLNEDGTLKGDAPAGEWWEPVVAYPMTIDNIKTVTVEEDLTHIFEPRRAVRTLPSYTKGIWVESSSYDVDTNLTSVLLTEEVLETDTSIQFGAPVDNGLGVASDEVYELGLSTTQATNPKQVKGDINRLENSLSNLDRVREDFTVPRNLSVQGNITVGVNVSAGGVIANNTIINNNVKTKTLTLDDYMNVPFDGINMLPPPNSPDGTATLQLQNASDINGVTGQRFDVDAVVDGSIVKSLFGASDTYGLWISKTGKWVVPENPPSFVGNANKWALKFHNGFIIQGGNESTSTTTINFLIPFTSTTYVTNLGFTIDGLASQIVTKSTTKMVTGATIRASFMHNWLAMGY